jgi:hypothetical protein
MSTRRPQHSQASTTPNPIRHNMQLGNQATVLTVMTTHHLCPSSADQTTYKMAYHDPNPNPSYKNRYPSPALLCCLYDLHKVGHICNVFNGGNWSYVEAAMKCQVKTSELISDFNCNSDRPAIAIPNKVASVMLIDREIDAMCT